MNQQLSNVSSKELNEKSQAIVADVVIRGDLSGLSNDQLVIYYNDFCKSLGLNPLTQPFQLIEFQGKKRLYATKDCTEQLRKIHGVSVIESKTTQLNDLYVVSVKVQDRNGRTDVGTGVVTLAKAETAWNNELRRYAPTGRTIPLTAEDLANAIMKAETKAKRRATLSICGLGILDESETDTIGKYKAAPIPTISDDTPVSPKEADWLESDTYLKEDKDELPSRQVDEDPKPVVDDEDEKLIRTAEEVFEFDEKECTCGTNNQWHKKDCPKFVLRNR